MRQVVFELDGNTYLDGKKQVPFLDPWHTPVEEWGGHLVKRDDLWLESAGQQAAYGGKARTAGLVCRTVKERGGKGLLLALARNSSVPGMLGRLCAFYGLELHLHIPDAKASLDPPFEEAVRNGAHIHRHPFGYMTVLKDRLREQRQGNPRLIEVGLGLHLPGTGADDAVADQVKNLPIRGWRRIVVPVGSGEMLHGILRGLEKWRHRKPVLGVCAARPPEIVVPERLRGLVTLVKSGVPFEKAVEANLGGLELDPIYEAKCLPFLQAGDLLWVVGHRSRQ